MQSLAVTDEQYEFIQRLRAEIAETVVGEYGFVREQDAVQYLIDNAEVECEVDVDAAAPEDVAESVEAAVAGEADPHRLEGVSYVESDEGAADASDGSTSERTPADGGDDGSNADGDEGGDESNADGDEGGDDAGAANDADKLDQMMNLLDTHEDKWDESPSADYRYRVELPDGSTEDVQTKDDVRALLFKNY